MNYARDTKLFEVVFENVKRKDLEFYAFLNKQFNILNKKVALCSLNCFSEQNSTTIKQALSCSEVCKSGMSNAFNFADNVQKENEEKLKYCIEKSRDILLNKEGEDKAHMFIKCYEELVKDYDIITEKIRFEFNFLTFINLI